MAKVLGLKQMLQRKYNFLHNLPEGIKRCFGTLTENFSMIIWGHSGNGKSSLIMDFLKCLLPYGNVLYVGLEEGFEATMQMNIIRNLNEKEHSGKIQFADNEMSIEELTIKLKKKKSPQFIIIDSVQYWEINYKQYKQLKETFKNKCFIYISHASGKFPDGKTADKIRYDVGLKVHVEGYIAFVISRYGGNGNYVIWEERAKTYWGKEYKKIIGEPLKNAQKTKTKNEKQLEIEEI